MTEPVRRFARPLVLDQIPLAQHGWIEASAGTGKTFTLEHLIVELIVRAGARLDEILVLTFTEKATLEMRERVRATLVALVHAGPEDARVNPGPGVAAWELDAPALARLREAVEAFESASIHTIHGYCQRVLKEHAFRSRGLLEQELTDTRRRFEQGVKAVLREVLRPHDPAHPLLGVALSPHEGGSGGSPAALARMLLEWATETGESMPRAELSDLQEAARACLGPLVDRALALAVTKESARTRAPVQLHLAALRALALQVERSQSLLEAAALVDAWRGGSQGSANVLEWLTGRLSKNPALARAFQPYGALLERVPQPRMLLVQTLLPRVLDKVRRAKQARQEMDFDDMLTRVRDALRGDEGRPLRAALRAQHRFAIVDEFQDTDATQWEIFRTLFFDTEAGLGGQGGRRAIYLIGDPKQAIYGFRGADVHTYLRARDDLQEAAPRVQLRDNYRSTATMIEAYNAVFEQGFFTGSIRYDHPVACGNPALVARYADERPAPPLVLMRPTQPEAEGAPKVDEVRSRTAEFIADEVVQLLGDSAEALRVGAEGHTRALTPADVYVLGRYESDLQKVHDALAARGVPCAYFKRRGLFKTREAEDLLTLLRAVADPARRSLRLKAWLTPFFGLTLEEVAGYEDVDDDHPLVARLVRMRERCEQHDYAGFAAEILSRSGLTRRELFVQESTRRLTNYQHLVDILLQGAFGRRRSIEELVNEFQRYVDGSARPIVGDDVERVAAEGEAVQLLTMHKSKGLEAEVVFVLGGLAASERPGAQPRVRHHDGRREAWMDPLPAAVAEDVRREVAEEDERVFYVALTRARSRLYLPYFGPPGRSAGAAGAPLSQGAAVDKSYKLSSRAAYQCVQKALTALVDSGRAEALGLEVRALPVGEGAPLAEPLPTQKPAVKEAEAPSPPRVLEPLHSPAEFHALRAQLRGPVATSYSRLRGRRASLVAQSVPHEEFKAESVDGVDAVEVVDAVALDAEASAASEPIAVLAADALQVMPLQLPGGASTGLFLHEALEHADLSYFATLGGPEMALSTPAGGEELRVLLQGSAARNGVAIDHVEEGARVLYHALTRPLPTRGEPVALVRATRVLREMSFQFPLPEAMHRRLGDHAGVGPLDNAAVRDGAPFRMERGVVRGVVDVVFEHAGRIYFLDWKSDRVAGGVESLRAHVQAHYSLQIRLYTLGVLRLLGVWDEEAYEARFGGHLYAFLRPMAESAEGVVFERPSFAEVMRWEAELREMRIGPHGTMIG